MQHACIGLLESCTCKRDRDPFDLSSEFQLMVCFKQLAITWKGFVRRLGVWDSVREIARFYDAAMGMCIFAPIAFVSWFPFVSTIQSRVLFNQAFSRGLEMSLILVGNKANVQI